MCVSVSVVCVSVCKCGVYVTHVCFECDVYVEDIATAAAANTYSDYCLLLGHQGRAYLVTKCCDMTYSWNGQTCGRFLQVKTVLPSLTVHR